MLPLNYVPVAFQLIIMLSGEHFVLNSTNKSVFLACQQNIYAVALSLHIDIQEPPLVHIKSRYRSDLTGSCIASNTP